MSDFKLRLDEEVVINDNDVTGIIVARAQYSNGRPNAYLIRYINGMGDMKQAWEDEHHLTAVPNL